MRVGIPAETKNNEFRVAITPAGVAALTHRGHEVLITIEEGSVGGFASHVLQYLATTGMLDSGLKIRPMVLPDRFIDHHKPEVQYAEAGLDAKSIVATALAALGRDSAQATARA